MHGITDTCMIYNAVFVGNPKKILQGYCDKLTVKLAIDLDRVTNALYAKELITQQTKDEMHVLGTTDYKKSCKLFTDIMRQLESSFNFNQYLINICHVFINHQALVEIASSILYELGKRTDCLCAQN